MQLVCSMVYAQQLKIFGSSYFITKGNVSIVIKDAALINSGNFSSPAGLLKFSGYADTTINYISGDSITNAYNLQLNNAINGISLKSPVVVKDSLQILQGNLYSQGFLTLRSTALQTAMVAPLPVNGTGIATSSVVGTVSVERYIPARKAWRLLSAPVQSSGAPTINASWQEGTTTASGTPNPFPGYGTHITGGTVANGYDQGVTSSTSIKTYNNTGNNWSGMPASGTMMPVSSYAGYFLYIRGDRGINLLQGANATATATTLRMKGQLKSGSQVMPVNALNYTVVGNPFTSPIDFHSVTRSNVSDKVYIWDPKMSGANGLGAYVTLIWNNNSGMYDATSSVSPITQYIPSGEAFIVTGSDGINPGTITVKETDKNNSGSDFIFGRNPVFFDPRARIDMHVINGDNTTTLLDGVLCTYADDNSNNVNGEDAIKINGSGEMIAMLRNQQMLSIERRVTISTADSIFLQIYQMRVGNYKLTINLTDLNTTGLTALLKDSYNPATNNTILNTNGTTEIPFTIINDPAAYAIGRFTIVFIPAVVLPVSIREINAVRNGENIDVTWKTENETGISEYTVERSADGIHFASLQSVIPAGTSGIGNYVVHDTRPLSADNYYRIKYTDLNTGFSYSRIVKVGMQPQQTGFNVLPNPVKEKINLQVTGVTAGVYKLNLMNSTGAVIFKQTLTLSQGSSSIQLNHQTLASGIYILEIIYPNLKSITKKIIVQ